jgi:hypothetical protein
MDIDVQEINKQLSRWAQAKHELTRQYEEYIKSIDRQIGLCHSMLEVVSTPLPTFDNDLIRGIASGTRTAPTVSVSTAPTKEPEENEEEEEDDDEEEEDEAPAKVVTPPAKVAPAVKVDTGRGGKPKLVDGMRYVLETHGPLHPTGIAEKIIAHDLAPNSKNLVDYIRYTLSKNKSVFLKVVGQRGMWQSAKGATPSPKAESSANAEELTAMSADDEIGEKLAEIQEIEAFRERERVGTIRLSPDEAKIVVDEMTDPRNLDKSDYSYVSSSV